MKCFGILSFTFNQKCVQKHEALLALYSIGNCGSSERDCSRIDRSDPADTIQAVHIQGCMSMEDTCCKSLVPSCWIRLYTCHYLRSSTLKETCTSSTDFCKFRYQDVSVLLLSGTSFLQALRKTVTGRSTTVDVLLWSTICIHLTSEAQNMLLF